tara:strand:+ start:57 stop:575 length:519 start_codon:yes stop_codon:yes gene_type:complete
MPVCSCCGEEKSSDNFVMSHLGFPLIPVCHSCSDEHFIEKIDCQCSVCKRKLPSSYFQHYRTRFKKNGMRLRVNTNCKDCSKKESAIVNKLKKENPAPEYLTECPQCNKIVYEKREDIPEGVEGTNGPWQCDHDHKTKEFRAYICKLCNTGTGMIGDNWHSFEKAVLNKKTK